MTAFAIWTPDSGTHELPSVRRGVPLTDVATGAVFAPSLPTRHTNPAARARRALRAVAAEMRGHLEDSWNAAVGSTVALVAACTGLVGSVFIDAATAVIS